MKALGCPVTASIGAASFRLAPLDADAALAQADALMYAAKAAGKNRIRQGAV
jgi:PleD family two-component response regulator